MFYKILFVSLGMSLYLPAAIAQDRIVAEAFGYPFKPISVRTVHYRLLSSGEGQVAIVSPDGAVETVQTLMQLTAEKTKALLASIERVKGSALQKAPKKDPDKCTPGGAEFTVFNSRGDAQLIARIENCEWAEIVQPEAQIVGFLLQTLQGISYLH